MAYWIWSGAALRVRSWSLSSCRSSRSSSSELSNVLHLYLVDNFWPRTGEASSKLEQPSISKIFFFVLAVKSVCYFNWSSTLSRSFLKSWISLTKSPIWASLLLLLRCWLELCAFSITEFSFAKLMIGTGKFGRKGLAVCGACFFWISGEGR